MLTQGAVSYSYDVDGNTIQKTGPSGNTDYTYDELMGAGAIGGGIRVLQFARVEWNSGSPSCSCGKGNDVLSSEWPGRDQCRRTCESCEVGT